ncbi:hypothetical protein AAZV13_01G043250 [Glycine max]
MRMYTLELYILILGDGWNLKMRKREIGELVHSMHPLEEGLDSVQEQSWLAYKLLFFLHYFVTTYRTSCTTVLTLAYQSLGVVYGDLSSVPIYVYKTSFSGKLSLKEDNEEIFGVLSFIFWTFTIIGLFKYVFIVMSTDDNGEV